MPGIVPSIIKGGIHAYSFIANLVFTMSSGPKDDKFDTLLSSTVRSNIALFVCSFFQFARTSSDPSYSLQHRFLVTSIGINKSSVRVQHESLAIWVLDKVTLKRHEFIIERVPSHRSYESRFSAFSQFPKSEKVLDSIQKALSNMRSLSNQVAESLCTAREADPEPETITLLPSESTNDPYHSLQTPTSFLDLFTSTLARGMASARTSSQSISPQSLAEDSISGYPLGSLDPANCIRRFNPEHLSLFEIVLLAQVVNQYAPIYGLFDNMCYMFASVIFDAVVQVYTFSPEISASTSRPEGPPAPTAEVSVPGNANILVLPTVLPTSNQAGRWFGILILDPIVKSTIVTIVVEKFKTERENYVKDIA
jgi:hypothetical protein